MRLWAELAAALLLAAASPARAADLQGFVEAGPEALDGTGYALLAPGFFYKGEHASVALQAPLRFRLNLGLARRDGLLRSQDWDDWSDAGRALRKLEVSLAERSVVFRLGAMAHQTLGHGTVVVELTNALDPDRMPLGAYARAVVGSMAVELLTTDVLRPDLMAASLAIEPLSYKGPQNDRVHLVASLAGDRRAPGGGANPVVWSTGLDVAVWRTDALKLAPYADFNGRKDALGLHLGVLADVAVFKAKLSVRGEWRTFQAPYQPEYFDVAYGLERWDAPPPPRSLGPVRAPKAEQRYPSASAFRTEARVSAGPFAAAAGVSSRGPGILDANGTLSLETQAAQLAFFTGARSFSARRDPDRVFLVGEARYRLTPFVHAYANVGRLYRIEVGGGSPGRQAELQLGAGLGIAASP